MNKLFYGDNLDVLRRFVRDETVDLCCIDPPFNSKRNYNQIYNNIGSEDRAQAQAFVDTWTWDDHANICFDELFYTEIILKSHLHIVIEDDKHYSLARIARSALTTDSVAEGDEQYVPKCSSHTATDYNFSEIPMVLP